MFKGFLKRNGSAKSTKLLPEPMFTNHPWSLRTKGIPHEMLHVFVLDMSLKLASLKLEPCVLGDNELRTTYYHWARTQLPSGNWLMIYILFVLLTVMLGTKWTDRTNILENLLLKYLNIDGLMQERRYSIANAPELHLSCINPSILYHSTLICDPYNTPMYFSQTQHSNNVL